MFTQSKCPSAPVEWCRAHLKGGKRGAGAGGQFRQRQCLHRQERPRGGEIHRRNRRQGGRLPAAEIFLASTGVIGEPLDARKFDGVMDALVARAAPGEFLDAAKAIMTTDTFPKVATATATIGKARSPSTASPRAPA